MSVTLKNRRLLRLEALETRVNPVAAFTWSAAGSTLTLTQVAGAVGALTITDDGVGTVSIDDASTMASPDTTLSTTGFANLTVTLLGTDTTAVTYNLTGARTGNVALNVANTGTRTLNLNATGAASIGGNLSLTGGNGALTVARNATALTIAGNATFNGGNASDTLTLGTTTTIGGNLTLNKINQLPAPPATVIVGGSFFFNSFGDNNANNLQLINLIVGGNLNYTGGNSTDVLNLQGTSTIGGNLVFNFGSQGAAASSNLVMQDATTIGGSLVVIGGNLGSEVVFFGLGASLAGNALLNMGGSTGAPGHDIDFLGTFGGSSFNYIGGAGVDNILYTPAAGSNRARFTAQLGAGDDVVAFAAAPGLSNPSFAFIDFGAGADSVTGLINFPFTFLNLP
jgi:hypothetical protein